MESLKFPIDQQFVDKTIQNETNLMQFLDSNIDINVKIHVLCHKILWIRSLPKSRISVDNKQDLNAGLKYYNEIDLILNNKLFEYQSYRNYLWPLLTLKFESILLIIIKEIRIIPKFIDSSKYFKIIRNGDMLAMFIDIKQNNEINKDIIDQIKDNYIFTNFNNIKNKLIGFIQIEYNNNFELNECEKNILNEYKTNDYFAIKKIILLDLKQIDGHQIYHSHNKRLIFRSSPNLNKNISTIAQLKFDPFNIYDNKNINNEFEYKYEFEPNKDPYTLNRCKIPGIYSFVKCCNCKQMIHIGRDIMNQNYFHSNSFLCTKCLIPDYYNNIYVNQIIYIYAFYKAENKWICIIYSPINQQLFLAFLPISFISTSFRLQSLIHYYSIHENNMELYLYHQIKDFNMEYKDICLKYMEPFLMNYFIKYINKKPNINLIELMSNKKLEMEILHPSFEINEIIEYWDNGWKLAKIITKINDSLQLQDCINQNKSFDVKYNIFYRKIGLLHKDIDIEF